MPGHFLADGTMTLYSTGLSANAHKAFPHGSDALSGPGTRRLPNAQAAQDGNREQANETKTYRTDNDAPLPWCYLFVHHAKMKCVSERIGQEFHTFIHTSIQHRRKDKHVRKFERPTIPGLLFVQGNCEDIRNYLHNHWPDLHLVNDCSTGKTAIIPDNVMRPFMLLSRTSPTRIRFMPHSFDYYSEGHALVRITSGPLAGLEGYCIRISRDKCLVSAIGGMTIAIGGIHKETFENLDHCEGLLHEQLRQLT